MNSAAVAATSAPCQKSSPARIPLRWPTKLTWGTMSWMATSSTQYLENQTSTARETTCIANEGPCTTVGQHRDNTGTNERASASSPTSPFDSIPPTHFRQCGGGPALPACQLRRGRRETCNQEWRRPDCLVMGRSRISFMPPHTHLLDTCSSNAKNQTGALWSVRPILCTRT